MSRLFLSGLAYLDVLRLDRMVRRQATTRDHRAWVRWYYTNGRNAAATCRHFDIIRSTFYRWLGRYDPTQPQKPLEVLSRRPRTKKPPSWTDLDLQILSELSMQHPGFGAGRLTDILHGHGINLSRATVGRMLAEIKRRCPACGMKDGRHDAGRHALAQDLLRIKNRDMERQALWEATLLNPPAGVICDL